jgi:hypothetical protein
MGFATLIFCLMLPCDEAFSQYTGNIQTTHWVNGAPSKNYSALDDELTLWGGGTYDLREPGPGWIGGWNSVHAHVRIYRWSFPSQIWFSHKTKDKPNDGITPAKGAFRVFNCKYPIIAPLEQYYLTIGQMYYIDLGFSPWPLGSDEYDSFSTAVAGGLGGE